MAMDIRLGCFGRFVGYTLRVWTKRIPRWFFMSWFMDMGRGVSWGVYGGTRWVWGYPHLDSLYRRLVHPSSTDLGTVPTLFCVLVHKSDGCLGGIWLEVGGEGGVRQVSQPPWSRCHSSGFWVLEQSQFCFVYRYACQTMRCLISTVAFNVDGQESSFWGSACMNGLLYAGHSRLAALTWNGVPWSFEGVRWVICLLRVSGSFVDTGLCRVRGLSAS
jgi:hypothetical protein